MAALGALGLVASVFAATGGLSSSEPVEWFTAYVYPLLFVLPPQPGQMK